MARRPHHRIPDFQRLATSEAGRNLARRIGRREFVRTTGGLFVAAAIDACGDGTNGPGPKGTVRVTITGLMPGFASAGTATIVGPGLGAPLQVPLPAVSEGELEVPVGTYTVIYEPPAGYTMAPGESNEVDVTVVEDEVVDVGFEVVAATATLRIEVVGGEGATQGSAQVLRTDIPGQVAVVVPVGQSGIAEASLLPGEYRVTFTPAPGFQVTAGTQNPQEVELTAETLTTVTFTVEAISAPTGVLFHSDWSTALGVTAAALRDTGKAKPWGFHGGSTGSIVTAASLGLTNWPTANAFRCQRQTHQMSVDIGAPSAGSARHFRYYLQVTYDDTHGAASNGMIEHGVETADALDGGGDGMNFYRIPRNNGTWFPGFREISTGYRYIAPGLSLLKNHTYRLEWRLAYGASTYTVQVRIFNASGVQVASDEDFHRVLPAPESTGAKLGSESFAYTASDHRYFRVGCNGPSSNFPLGGDASDTLFVHGAVAISTTDWCGPYAEGI